MLHGHRRGLDALGSTMVAASREGGMMMASGAIDGGERVPSLSLVLPLGLGAMPSITSTTGIGASRALSSWGLVNASPWGAFCSGSL